MGLPTELMVDTPQPRTGRESTDLSTVKRRDLLKSSVAAGTAFGLAGCIGGTGGGGDELTVGVVTSLSGPFASAGEANRQAVELAVEHANENNEAGDREIAVEARDAELDSGVAVEKATELINNGVDVLCGNVSSTVGLALADLANRENVVYHASGAAQALTGAECKPTVFGTSNSTVMQAAVPLQYLYNQQSSQKLYIIALDYSAGENIAAYSKRTVPELGGEVIGTDFIPPSQTDFSSLYTKISETDADMLMLHHFGSGLASGIRQASEFGILDQMTVVAPVMNLGAARSVPQEILAHENFYGTEMWYWGIEAPDTAAFVDPFRSQYGGVPTGLAACFYAALRTHFNAVNEEGTTDADPISQNLEGRQWDQDLWDRNVRYRSCDHRASIPSPLVTGTKPSEFSKDQENYFEVITIPDDPEQTMLECSRTGCSL